MLPDKKSIAALPSWANLVVPRFKTHKAGRESSLSLHDEESYLRTRCFHAMSRQMDLAAANALQELSIPFQEKLGDTLSSLAPQESHDSSASPSPSKRSRTLQEEDDSDAAATDASVNANASTRCTIEPPTRYNPLLLPVMILDAPTYRLDRQDWMRHLVLSTKRNRPRSAVVWLRPATNLTVSWQEELTRQCLKLAQDLPPALLNKRKLANASLTDILLQWAGYTQDFDDILVFVQADESLHSPEMQDFIHWLAERRALSGLPFCLLLLGPAGDRRRLELRSLTQGPVGLLVRKHVLASTDEWLERFTDNLWAKQAFPVAFQSLLVSTITESYREQTQSAVNVQMQLKAALAHYFIPRGSFRICMVNDRFLWEERSRMAWFLLDEDARRFVGTADEPESRLSVVDWLQELELRRRKACVALQVLGLLGQGGSAGGDLPFLYCAENGKSQRKRLEQQIGTKERHRVMSVLAGVRTKSQGDLNPLVFSQPKHVETLMQGSLGTLANELIILLDKCTQLSEADNCLHPIVDDWLEQLSTLPNAPAAAATASTSLSTQPRRHLVGGVIENVPVESNSSFSVANVPCILFNLVQGRVSISQDEWFSAFSEAVMLQVTRHESVLLFAYGLNFLKVSGLIRDKRLRGAMFYEKAALVWSSGD